MTSSENKSLLNEAGALAANGSFARARQILTAVLDTTPDDIDALGMLGNIEKADRNFVTASKCFSQIIALQPENAWPYYDFAFTAELSGNNDQAAQYYLKAWEIDPNNARFALYAGYALWMCGDKSSA